MASDPRFLLATGQKHSVFTEEENKDWTSPFLFVQLADTQLGMLSGMLQQDKRVWDRFSGALSDFNEQGG